jgi:hypothetical protein
MKLGEAKINRKVKPFFEDEKIKIITTEVNNKITSFICTAKYKNEERTFTVIKYDILSAWIKMEKFCSDLM